MPHSIRISISISISINRGGATKAMDSDRGVNVYTGEALFLEVDGFDVKMGLSSFSHVFVYGRRNTNVLS